MSTTRLTVHPHEAVPLVGSFAVRAVQGRVRLLGVDLSPSSDASWHVVHSPAGGLMAALQTTSAVCSGATVLVRKLEDVSTARKAREAAGKRKKQKTEAKGRALGGRPMTLAASAIAAPVEASHEEAAAEAEDDDDTGVELGGEEVSTHDVVDGGNGLDDDQGPSDDELATGSQDVKGVAGGKGGTHGVRSLRPVALTSHLGALVPPAWEAAIESLACVLSNAGGGSGRVRPAAAGAADAEGAIILLSGGRNMGKSSFGRLLLNRALSAGAPSVRLLDCDVGQSELAPPGLISLHEVDKPLMSPPSTNLRPPLTCRFVGQSTPADRPTAYVACIAALIAEHRATLPPRPLLINTCGWVTGLGGQLLADIAAAAAPTHLVHFEGGGGAGGMAPSPPAPLVEALAAVRPPSTHPTAIVCLPPLKAAFAGSATGLAEGLPTALMPNAPPAAELRAMQLLAYLGALPSGLRALLGSQAGYTEAAWQTCLSAFHATPPYAVPIDALQVCTLQPARGACGVPLSRSDLLRSLNASLVGLLAAPPASGDPGGDRMPGGDGGMARGGITVCDEPAGQWADHPCLGLGLVRSVDEASGMLFVSTPVPAAQLATVTVLVRSSLDLPIALLQPTALTPASPFLAADALRAGGGDQMRSRNNLLRGNAR